MADNIVKLIPINYKFKADTTKIIAARKLLESTLKYDDIKICMSEYPEFADCGSNFESVLCPVCGVNLNMGWWEEQMDICYEKNFSDLSVILPCCGACSSMNDLDYRMPCGFSRLRIELLNPKNEITIEIIQQINKIFGIDFKRIDSRI